MFRQITIGTIALVAMALALAGRAEAGASASAASKYSRSHQQLANPSRDRNNFAITEYSSSSARSHSRCSTTTHC